MISFRSGSHRFHLRAAAIIVHNGAVLLHRADDDDFWALPGGRVEAGEDAASAVVREMQEELGISVSATRLACVVENFFSYAGERHHETGLYFQVDLEPGSLVLTAKGPYQGQEGNRKLTFSWHAVESLAKVDLRPSFLSSVLAEPNSPFRHVVHRDDAL